MIDDSLPAVLRNICFRREKPWLNPTMVIYSRGQLTPHEKGLLSYFAETHDMVDEPFGAPLAKALYLEKPLGGEVRWLPGRSLWFAQHLCRYAETARLTMKLPSTLSHVGRIDQVTETSVDTK